MTQESSVFSRFAIDLGGALLGFLIGLLCLQFFRNGVSLPLDNTDWFVLIFTTFSVLLLSSVLHKYIGQAVKPLDN